MNTKKMIVCFTMICSMSFSQNYFMPHENEEHEGTWLQWPHQYEYGISYRNSLDATWVEITAALVNGEKVHIVAYNDTEKNRIIDLLSEANISMSNVDFFINQTNDVWVRDNGPVFVYDNVGNIKVEDWGFNGWGGKFNYDLCDQIPSNLSLCLNYPVINLNSIMTNEGGAVELDGNGVLLACKSSVISQSPENSIRNPGMSQIEAENIFSQYLGVSKFIWLEGNVGDANDMTDFHIDGFAKFVNDSVLITMNNTDLTYWGLTSNDITILYGATNKNNEMYQKIYIPLTQNNVVTTNGNDLGYKGSYVNFYVANGIILVPNYNDPNDIIANSIIEQQYPDRTAVGIDVRNLYQNGGMVHCVTQQQPKEINTTGFKNNIGDCKMSIIVVPNPCLNTATIKSTIEIQDVTLIVFDGYGRPIRKNENINLQSYVLNCSDLVHGMYFIQIRKNDEIVASTKFIII